MRRTKRSDQAVFRYVVKGRDWGDPAHPRRGTVAWAYSSGDDEGVVDWLGRWMKDEKIGALVVDGSTKGDPDDVKTLSEKEYSRAVEDRVFEDDGLVVYDYRVLRDLLTE